MLASLLSIGLMPSPLPSTLLTDYLHQSFLTNLHGKHFFTKPQTFLISKHLGAYAFPYSDPITLTNYNPDPLLVFFWVILPFLRAIFVLTQQLTGSISQDMLSLMRLSFCLICPPRLSHLILQSHPLLTPHLGCWSCCILVLHNPFPHILSQSLLQNHQTLSPLLHNHQTLPSLLHNLQTLSPLLHSLYNLLNLISLLHLSLQKHIQPLFLSYTPF